MYSNFYCYEYNSYDHKLEASVLVNGQVQSVFSLCKGQYMYMHVL